MPIKNRSNWLLKAQTQEYKKFNKIKKVKKYKITYLADSADKCPSQDSWGSVLSKAQSSISYMFQKIN